MFLRIIGSLAVIAGCTALGVYYSAKDGFRVQELQEFKKALLILLSEIEYMRTPLAVACENIASRTALTISPLFSDFAELVASKEGESTYQMWCTALASIRPKTFMAAEDLDIIEGFGKTLGYLDQAMQKNAIGYAINYIDEKTTSLNLQGDKNKRMYRSLGVIGGLLITVALW